MTRASRSGREHKTKVVRNGNNYVAGFALVLMSIGLFILADPWMIRIYDDLPSHDRMTPLECTLATAGLCVIATVGVALIRLRVEIEASTRVRVVNPFCTWGFHTARIVDVNERIFPRLTLDTGQRVYLVAAEQSTAMRLSGKRVAGIQAVTEPEERDHIGASQEVMKEWKGMVAYTIPWLLGAALSLIGLQLLP